MPKFSTRTFATAGDRKAGRVGPRWIFFYPQGQQGQQYDHGFLLIPGNIVDNRQIIDIFQSEDFFQLQGDHCQRVAVIALSGIQYPGNSPISPRFNLLYLYLAQPAVRITVSSGRALAKSV